jgi:hypothetical protein
LPVEQIQLPELNANPAVELQATHAVVEVHVEQPVITEEHVTHIAEPVFRYPEMHGHCPDVNILNIKGSHVTQAVELVQVLHV